MNATATSPLPVVWDLSSFFPAMDSREYRDFKGAVASDLAAAIAAASALAALPAESAAWEQVFLQWEDLGARASHLFCYIGCLSAANAADEAIQAEEASLELIGADLTKLGTQLMASLKEVGDEAFARLLERPKLSDAKHTLSRLRTEAVFQMPPDQEALSADLGVNGYKAFGRLYDTLTGKLTFEMTYPDGRREVTPMAQCRALMANPDRAVRRAAFEGGRKVWQANLDTCAAVVNSLAGTRHTLYARRGREHFLDAPLYDAALSRESLDAMFAAVTANYSVGRRVTALAAKLQKTPALAWYDLEAPSPLEKVPDLTWDEAVASVQAAFDAAYPRFGDYFRSMIQRRWIESEKRANKRSGAFQTSSPVLREERIFMTFSGAMHDVVTLAHEAGHAWHTHVLAGKRPCAREYPMTLAETASTFAEQIFIAGMLAKPGLSDTRRAFLLDTTTNRIPAYLLNIPVRFIFEKRFYEERREGTVSPTRLNALMAAAQREVYGDTLAADGVDPTFWASKQHFSFSGLSFYNFPYTFGFILSQALFAEFERSGAAFLPQYEAFLRETGSASCEDAVRQTLGWDLRQTSFWDGAIKTCLKPIEAYERLVAKKSG